MLTSEECPEMNVGTGRNNVLQKAKVCQTSYDWWVGWLVFNVTFSTDSLYHAMSAQEIN